MARRILHLADNEPYDPIFQLVAVYTPQTVEKSVAAASLYAKLCAVGTPTEKVGRFQHRTLFERDGPQTVFLLESEKDLLLEILRAWRPTTFDLDLKARILSLVENATLTEVADDVKDDLGAAAGGMKVDD